MRKTNATLSALLCAATMVWAGSALALNPQPLPPGSRAPVGAGQFEPPDPCIQSDRNVQERTRPGQHKTTALACGHNGVNPGARNLNPQPLPPG